MTPLIEARSEHISTWILQSMISTWTPIVCKIMAFWAVFLMVWATILHTLGVQVVAPCTSKRAGNQAAGASGAASAAGAGGGSLAATRAETTETSGLVWVDAKELKKLSYQNSDTILSKPYIRNILIDRMSTATQSSLPVCKVIFLRVEALKTLTTILNMETVDTPWLGTLDPEDIYFEYVMCAPVGFWACMASTLRPSVQCESSFSVTGTVA